MNPLLTGIQIGDIIRVIGDVSAFYGDMIGDSRDIDFAIGDVLATHCGGHQSACSDSNGHPFVDPITFAFAAEDRGGEFSL